MEITFGSSAQRLLYGIFNGGRRHKAIRAFDDLSVIWKARAFRCQYIWNHLEIFLWIQEPSECPCLIHTRDFNEALSLYLADYRMAPCQPSTEGTIHLVNVRQEHCDCVRIYGGGGHSGSTGTRSERRFVSAFRVCFPSCPECSLQPKHSPPCTASLSPLHRELKGQQGPSNSPWITWTLFRLSGSGVPSSRAVCSDRALLLKMTLTVPSF